MAKSVSTFFASVENAALIDELETLGVNVHQLAEEKKREPIPEGEGGPLAGKTILFTGKLTQFTRATAQEAALQAGATISSGVSKALNILVVGEKAGSKLKKAEAIGTVKILSEAEFGELIAED